jgi:SsrA-binding protein
MTYDISAMPTLAVNKKARYDYSILDTLEAGIQLTGAEVKSVRAGRLNLAGSRVVITRGEAYLLGAQIAAFPQAGLQPGYDPQRTRKLLLHQREIRRLVGKLEEAGLTVVPLSTYTKGPHLKVEIAVARGKKEYEKRDVIKKREAAREARHSMMR